jgi:uncharacterized protein with von Willebrand factor type A (vWA) domain
MRAGDDPVVERIVRLGRSLRAGGVKVALAEIVDASRAATTIDLSDRNELRLALRATLVKDPRHYPQFDAAFDRLFPARPRPDAPHRDTAGSDPAALLASGAELAALAAALVDEHAGLDAGELRGERHHVQRVHRAADLARLMSEARLLDPALTSDELRARIEELKRLIVSEVRARVGDPEVDAIPGELEDVEFLRASRVELERIRLAIRPLARRLAARLARRRQGQHRGRVNLRRTARRSLATGGVPFDVAYERPRLHRPELYVLCDISGSVAEFSLFTLTLMAALSAEVTRTRSFVFVDAIDEVTDLLAATDHGIEPWQLMRNTDVVGRDGHSDYGAVLHQFWDEIGDRHLGPNSTVLVTGDARTNYRDTGSVVLAQIARRCRRVYWLNPEPRVEWDTHDSAMAVYARSCSEVFEVRNLRQLVACVEQIL